MAQNIAIWIACFVGDIEDFHVPDITHRVKPEVRSRIGDRLRNQLREHLRVEYEDFLVRSRPISRIDVVFDALGRSHLNEGRNLGVNTGRAGEPACKQVANEHEPVIGMIDSKCLQQSRIISLATVSPANITAQVCIGSNDVPNPLRRRNNRHDRGAVRLEQRAVSPAIPQELQAVLVQQSKPESLGGATRRVGGGRGRVFCWGGAIVYNHLGHDILEVLMPIPDLPFDFHPVGNNRGDGIQLHPQVKNASEFLGAEVRAVEGSFVELKRPSRRANVDRVSNGQAQAAFLTINHSLGGPSWFRVRGCIALVGERVNGL